MVGGGFCASCVRLVCELSAELCAELSASRVRVECEFGVSLVRVVCELCAS